VIIVFFIYLNLFCVIVNKISVNMVKYINMLNLIILSGVYFNKMKIDSMDRKIINELVLNSKISLRKLATMLNVSFVTVMNRIKKLEKSGVISGYSVNVDFEKLGYDVHVLIEIRIAKGKLLELEKKIAKSPNVYAVYDTTGEYDATILAKFKSTRMMDSFIKKMQTYDFVQRTNTKLVLNTIKEKQISI